MTSLLRAAAVAALMLACPFVLDAQGEPARPVAHTEGKVWRPTVASQILAAGLPKAGPEDLKAWPAGPVRYLLNGAEERLYRGLGSDRERRAFISQFWLRRDPDLGSLENEFRFEFWQRVVEANRLFTHAATPGWKTDRGKFHIILGPPDEIERQAMPNRRSGTTVVMRQSDGTTSMQRYGADAPGDGFLGLERWIYHSPPGRTLPPHFVLAFRLESSGDYELSTEPRDVSLFQEMLSEGIRVPEFSLRESESDPARNRDLMTIYNELALAFDLGKLEETPDPQRLLAELVTSETFFGGIPFLLQTDYYRTAGEATLAVFTVGVDRRLLAGDGERSPNLLVVGRLESLQDPSQTLLLAGEDALVPSPDNADGGRLLLYQAALPIFPGTYKVSFGILQRSQQRIGSSNQTIRVPRFSGTGLALSTLALARRLAPLEGEEAGAPDGAAAFRLGTYQVVPKTEPRFANGEDFSVYYQIYGATPDPRTGAPRLQVTYRFFVLEKESFTPIGEPIRYADRTLGAQGWSFPLIQWPEATFRLEVTVEDLVSGAATAGQVLFSVGPPQDLTEPVMVSQR